MAQVRSSSPSSPQYTRPIAAGEGWSAVEFLCSAGPGDRPFEVRHERVTIANVIEGAFSYRAGNQRAILHSGALLLGNAHTCYECRHEHSRGDRCVSVQFDFDFFGEVSASMAGSSAFRFPAPSIGTLPAITALFARLGAPTSSPLACDIAAIRLAELVISGMSATVVRDIRLSARDERRISRAIRYIEANVHDEINLDEIAREAGTSKYHFLRSFRRQVEVTPYRFVLDTRLRRAAISIAATSEPIS